MIQNRSVEKTYPLDAPFLIRVPWEINNFLVSFFDGNSKETLLRFEREETGTEHRIQLRWGLTNLGGRTIWLCNKIAQPEKTLTIIFSDQPVDIITGVPFVPIVDAAGETQIPATEEGQSSSLAQLAALEARQVQTIGGLTELEARQAQTIAGLTALEARQIQTVAGVSATVAGVSVLEERQVQTIGGLTALEARQAQTIAGLTALEARQAQTQVSLGLLEAKASTETKQVEIRDSLQNSLGVAFFQIRVPAVPSRLPNLPILHGRTLLLKALAGNIHAFNIGDSTVSHTCGYEMLPGENITLKITNANNLWAVQKKGPANIVGIAET